MWAARPAGRPKGQVRQNNATCRKRVADGTSVFGANFPRGKIAEKYGKPDVTIPIPTPGAFFVGDRASKPLIFREFPSGQASVFLSEKAEDTETDAPRLRKWKNKDKMGKSDGEILAQRHLSRDKRWAEI